MKNTRVFATLATLAAACLAPAALRAQAPGYAYATDTANKIIEINLSNGIATPYTGTTVFPANALGFATNLGMEGSVIYSSTTTTGELGIWDRYTNQHRDLGNITSSTFTDPYGGSSLADAAYWDGGDGLNAGYYVVDSSRNVYRVDLTATAITQVTKVATIPTTNLSNNSLAFGDIAFAPSTGLLFLSDSNNGLFTFNITSGVVSRINSSYYGQIAFGGDGSLYGVGNHNLVASSQGNDLYRINQSSGAITVIAQNTDSGQTYRDLAGYSLIDVAPEPTSMALTGAAFVLGAIGFARRRA